jgi:hypothetical protein
MCDWLGGVQGIVVVPVDQINSVRFQYVLEDHIAKKADVTLLLKQKKEFGKDEKKPDFDWEPEVDIVFMSEDGHVYALRDVEICDYSGLTLPASTYRKVSRGSVQRVVDSRVYIFGQRVCNCLLT